jgi:hypothetical protein
LPLLANRQLKSQGYRIESSGKPGARLYLVKIDQ